MLDIISLQESERLVALEKVVTAGLQSWIEVGEALIEIRDSRLYRVEHDTFEEYCQQRVKMERRHAYRLMEAAPIAREVSPVGHISERAIREIAKVEPARRAEVFQAATEASNGHVPTARVIKQIVEMDDATEEKRELYPFDRIVLSEESKRAGEEAKKDSQNLYNLKWNWRRANKKDRAAFLLWSNEKR